MSEKPLSKLQQELLDAMRAGAVVHYMKYAGRFNPTPYYFRSDKMQRCTKQAEALMARGLVTVVKENDYGDHKLVATQREEA